MKKNRRTKNQVPISSQPQYGIDYDDYHAQIIGFTSGGASYGITWEEAESMNQSTEANVDEDPFDFLLHNNDKVDEEENDIDNDLSRPNEKK